MTSISKLVIATGNTKKLREFERLLAPIGIEVLAQIAFNVPEAPEPHCTFLENALAKARNASRHTGLPALADDSGICVHALGGNPGVNSAYYAGPQKSDVDNNEKLLNDMHGVMNRSAHFTCLLALVVSESDPEPLIAEGRWYGHILAAPRGNDDFGYNPLFMDAALNLSAAEMSLDQKAGRSHRGKALAKLLTEMQQRYGATDASRP